MSTNRAVLADLATFRAELREHPVSYRPLLKLTIWRPLRDVAWDWTLILLATMIVVRIGAGCVPVALLIIGNRQRALGNLLHDAGHRNLHRSPALNDWVARLLIAPALLASLASYRDTHFRHHLELGHAVHDPDYLPPAEHRVLGWQANYARQVFSLRAWWGTLTGHLGARHVALDRKAGILVWWLAILSLQAAVAGVSFMVTFMLLWIAARATVLHLITIFREMCDHFGLVPGGVLSFSRDVVTHGPLRLLVHPRNNGYHLTHHLLPAVPYYRLPQAHRLFSGMPSYRFRGTVCRSYVQGVDPVVEAWHTGARP